MDQDERKIDDVDTDHPLGKASWLLSKLENVLNVLAAFTILAVMLGTTVYIATRLLGFPIPAYLDISELAIAVFAFGGAAYAQRLGTHIRMELFVDFLRGRLRWLIEALSTLVALGLVIVLIVYSWDYFLNAWTIGDSTVDYDIPTWPAKLLVPVAFTIWAVRLVIELIGFIRLVIHPDAKPIAVPLILDPAEQAEQEIIGA